MKENPSCCSAIGTLTATLVYAYATCYGERVCAHVFSAGIVSVFSTSEILGTVLLKMSKFIQGQRIKQPQFNQSPVKSRLFLPVVADGRDLSELRNVCLVVQQNV